MQRYFHPILLFLAIYFIATGGLFSANSYLTLTWAEEEKVDNKKKENRQDNAHVQEENDENKHNEDEHNEDDSLILTDKAKTNISLKTAKTDVRSIERVVQVTGNIIAHPGKRAIVTPRIGGIVKRLHFNLGDSVKEGDVLLELESVDLQLAEIDLIEAVQQQKSLNAKLTKQKSAFAEQIRLELQSRQIDYLESFAEMQEQKTAYLKHKALATAKIISTLEQMRVDFVKADVERKLFAKTLERVETLTEKRISAQKELIGKKAEYTKATNAFTGAKRQFQILGVSEQTLEKIITNDGTMPILVLLNADSKSQSTSTKTTDSVDALKYVALIEEASGLVDAETAYKFAVVKVKATKQRALAAGLTATHLETITKTAAIIPFKDLSADKLIENYAPFMTGSEGLESLLQTEEAQRNAAIALAKVEQKLKVFGRTTDEINKIIETGKSHPRFRVTAPTAGQIIKQDVTLGATVEKNSSLYAILNTDFVWVEGEAYEDMLALLQDKWKVGIEVRIRVPAYPGTVFTGKVSQISAVVNPEKRTVHFWTAVDNSTRQLKPGMFAEQTLIIEKLDDVLSVPLNAVLEDGTTKFVFVESDNTYFKHEVEVGAKDDQYIEIKDGLHAGELVVIQGTHQLMRASAGSADTTDPHAGHVH